MVLAREVEVRRHDDMGHKDQEKILNNNLGPDMPARLCEAFPTLSLMDGGGGTDSLFINSSFETLFLSDSFNLRGAPGLWAASTRRPTVFLYSAPLLESCRPLQKHP